MTLKRRILIISLLFALGLNSGGLGVLLQVTADDQMAKKPIMESDVKISTPSLSIIGSKDHLTLSRAETADHNNPGEENLETDQRIPSQQSSLQSRGSSVSLLASYAEHDPIYIWHNDNFTDLGFLGGGTPTVPYQIVGLNITNTTGPLIEIRDTTAYFNISGNLLGGLEQASRGIELHNVTHGRIETNKVVNCTTDGIWLESSNNTILFNNTVYNNDWTGIKLTASSNHNIIADNSASSNKEAGIWLGEAGSCFNNIVANNTAYDNNWAGIQIDSSINNTLSNNTLFSNYGGGIALASSNNHTIIGNLIYDNYGGIIIGGTGGSHNNSILHNVIDNNGDNMDSGIWLADYSTKNALINNTVTQNYEGIHLSNCMDIIIYNNTVSNSAEAGIALSSSGGTIIVNNTVYNNNWDGIRLHSSNHNNTIANNTAYNNLWNGIRLEDFNNDNVIFNNTVFDNHEAGIWIYNNEGQWANSINRNVIIDNRAFNNNWAGIFILRSNDNQIANNTVYGCEHGIQLEESHNNKIANNTAYSNRRQNIRLISSASNEISRNTIQNSNSSGILIFAADDTAIVNNRATSCGWTGHNDPNSYGAGITVMESANVEIHDNAVYNNPDIGIQVWDSTDTSIRNNSVTESLDFGIFVNATSTASIANNFIAHNANYGIDLEATVADCLLWANILADNGVNAKDDGARNRWDNDSHGNWWADYSGADWNQDGIGDTPYDIPGEADAQDRYPRVTPTAALPDTTSPSINAPLDVSYMEGTTGHLVTWQATDTRPSWFNITIDGILVGEGRWTGTVISITIDGLAVGTYTYILVVYDQVGNSASDTVIVTVTGARTTTMGPSDGESEGDSKEPSAISPGFTITILMLSGIIFFVASPRFHRKRKD